MKKRQSGASCHMTNFQTTWCVCDGEKIDTEQKEIRTYAMQQ